MFDKYSFAARIGEIAREVGSLNKLSQKSGIQQTTLNEWARGNRVPRIDTLFRFAAGAGVDVAELIGLNDGDPDSTQPRHQKCRHDGPKALVVNSNGDMRVEPLADGDT